MLTNDEVEILKQLDLKLSKNPNEIVIDGLNKDEVWAMICSLSKKGLVKLTKTDIWLSNDGFTYLREILSLRISRESRMTEILRNPITSHIKRISSTEWGVLIGLLSLIIAAWAVFF